MRKRGYVYKVAKGPRHKWGMIAEEGNASKCYFLVELNVIGRVMPPKDSLVEFDIEPNNNPFARHDRAVNVALVEAA